MITVATYNGRGTKDVCFYQEFEVDIKDIIPWGLVNRGHIGKYVMFDDGTRLLAKILGATNKIVITSAGQVRKDDIVHCAVPKDPTTTVFGIDLRDVHPYVKKYTKSEIALGLRFLTNPLDKTIQLTKRVKMFTIEELEKTVKEDDGYKAEDAYTALKAAADPKNFDGKHYWKALRAMWMLHGGVDIEKIDEEMRGKKLSGGRSPALRRLESGEDSGRVIVRELPSKRDLKNMAGEFDD